ncbi:17747_t:CDS:1, partial [Cetraspora pellucida]
MHLITTFQDLWTINTEVFDLDVEHAKKDLGHQKYKIPQLKTQLSVRIDSEIQRNTLTQIP